MDLYKACQDVHIRQRHWQGTVVGIPASSMADDTNRLCGKGYTQEKAVTDLRAVIAGECSERCNEGTIGCDRAKAEVCQSIGKPKTERIPPKLSWLQRFSIAINDIVDYAKWRFSRS